MSKVPRFLGMHPRSDQASEMKRKNKKTGGKAELLLRRMLWKRGMRYRIHVRSLPGNPDIVFFRQRLAIFVDGDFWHGRNWHARREALASGTNSSYWIAKIEYNIMRDAVNTLNLEALGWLALRFWETDVLVNPEAAGLKINKRLTQLR